MTANTFEENTWERMSVDELKRVLKRKIDKIQELEKELAVLGRWKCKVCGSPNRHDREIHTFVCTNSKCGYRDWYPERQGDINTVPKNAKNAIQVERERQRKKALEMVRKIEKEKEDVEIELGNKIAQIIEELYIKEKERNKAEDMFKDAQQRLVAWIEDHENDWEKAKESARKSEKERIAKDVRAMKLVETREFEQGWNKALDYVFELLEREKQKLEAEK